jgi:hypothetical protein
MPEWDRWWPLGLLAGTLLVGASAFLGVWYLASLFAFPALIGLPILHELGKNGSLVVINGGWAGLWALSASRRARQRVRARRLALRGDLSAMPLAIISADVEKAPEAGKLPLTLAWRHQPKTRERGVWLLPAIGGPTLLAFFIVLSAQVPGEWQYMSTISAHNALADVITSVLLLAGSVLVTVVSWAGLIKKIVDPLGPAYAVRADDDGIRALHLRSEGPLLRWSDVRVFEVSNQYGLPTREIFRLCSSDRVVWWADTGSVAGESAAAYADRWECQRRLLALVMARTGMRPRTCTPSLMRDLPRHGLHWGIYVFRFGLLLAVFLMSIASLILPLTPVVALNAYAATTIALVGGVIVWGGRQRRESPPAAPYALTAASALPEEPADIVYGDTSRRRLQFAGIGLLFVLDAVPAIVAFTNVPAAPTPAFRVQVVAWSLAALAFIGSVVLAHGLSGNRTRLRIDSAGLTESEGRESTWLAWDDIVHLSVKMSKGGPASFTALGLDGEAITWPARIVFWRGSGRAPAPVSPEELAAIVAQRSGVRLTIE